MKRRRTMGYAGVLALVLALALAAAACGGGGGTEETTAAAPETTAPAETAAPAETGAAADTGTAAPSGEPLVIGAAFDLTGNMAPFDAPALAAAQIEVQKINDAGGINGQPVELKYIDTQLDPEQTKAAAIDLIDQGAKILLVTCDVDYATPAVQEAISRGVLAIAPCIGTDQMGPKRFGDAGKLAFSIGNVAQDEGAAMAEYAYNQKGWKTAATVTDNVIVYFQDVVKAFTKRFEELGGKIVKKEEWTNGDGTIQNVVSSLADTKVDVIATSTAFDDLPALVSGLRSLGDDTPILCSWSCDGTYWVPDNISNFYLVTYASIFGDDPSQEVKDLIQAMTDAGSAPGTGGFVTGAATIDAIKAAVEQAGSTDGSALATVMEGFQGVPTISGPISFSPELHSVFGRPYRVIEIGEGGKASVVGEVTASSPADIGG